MALYGKAKKIDKKYGNNDGKFTLRDRIMAAKKKKAKKK